MFQCFRGDGYARASFDDIENNPTHIAAAPQAAKLSTNTQGGESHSSRQRQDVWLALIEGRDTDFVGFFQDNFRVVYSDLVALCINGAVGDFLGDHGDSK